MWLDRFIKGSLLFLLLFTPLAFGAVHTWAYSLVEGIVALMAMAWALKMWHGRKLTGGAVNGRVWPYVLPLTLFLAFVLLQMVPLPPSTLRAISPSTYEVYTKGLPGWPEQAPYGDLMAIGAEEKQKEETVSGLPSPVGAWLPLSIAPTLTREDLLKFTTCALLFFLVLFYPAPGAARDPAHRVEYEIEFVRPFLYAILISAFLVATLGFLNLFTWNGRVLWFFVPYDVGGGGDGVRASAPFIAPPSFANYLAMTLPLMVVAIFWRTFLAPDRLGAAMRVLCGFAAFLMFCGILLSLSRAGWAATLLGLGVLVLLMAIGRGGPSWIARTPVRRLMTFVITGACLFLVVALMFVGPQGQESLDLRLQETATEAESLYGRFAVWHDSLDMVRDFPVLGVGLGAWPDLFPRYQNPRLDGFYREAHNDYLELLTETGAVGAFLLAWFFVVCLSRILKHAFSLDPKIFPVAAALVSGMSAMAFHEIFDFNLQIPANAILFTLFLAVALRLVSATGKWQPAAGCGNERKANSPERARPRARHGAFDSVAESTHMWRLAHDPDAQDRTPGTGRPTPAPQHSTAGLRSPVPGHGSPVASQFPAIVGSLTLAVSSILLFFTAFAQPMTLYPYNLRKQASVGDALEAVYNHPANAEAHIALFDAVKDKRDVSWQLNALERILWLAPGQTAVRDAYASRLLLQGRKEEAWYAVTRSVAEAPSVNRHFYLSPSVAATLFPHEQEAVVFGFKKGIEDGHPEALEGLAEFYRRTGRYSDRADLYDEAAARVSDPNEKADYFLKAADAAIKGEDLLRAEDSLREATRLQPDDTALFVKLVSQVYIPRKDLVAAEKAVAEGIRNGADALTLRVSLAEAARAAGENEIAEAALGKALLNGSNGTSQVQDRYGSYVRLARVAGSIGRDEVQARALEKAISLQPNSYEALMEVAGMYSGLRDYNRAAFHYRKATRANPTSVNAFAGLASIEEQRFRFAEADKAYANAVRLAPRNEGLRSRYEAFKERLVEDKGRGLKTGD